MHRIMHAIDRLTRDILLRKYPLTIKHELSNTRVEQK